MSQTAQGRKLGRKTGERKSLLRGQVTQLFRHEKIQTTLPKAKESARLANHLIAVAKKGDLNARRRVAKDIQDKEVITKLFDVLALRYQARVGGCTQIFKLSARQGDNAPMALLKLIA